MRKNNVPSSLTDYNSLWNPVLEAFTKQVISADDKSHFLHTGAQVGLSHENNRIMIDPLVLQSYGAKEVSLQKDEVLFREGEEAQYYFQVLSGAIKMITNSPDGQEFIQGVFKGSDSFGEPPLLCSFPYPSHAIALEPSVVIKLSKEKFLTLLRENFDIHLHLDKVLCQRLRYKSMVLSEISFYDPEHRIMSLLKYLKEDSRIQNKRESGMVREGHNYIVPFTRQQLADMSGLRVETVIRTVKKMEEDGKVKLIGRKITL
jgi:CRP/FNR family transcriptional regulator, cyclic AMP receptor protein